MKVCIRASPVSRVHWVPSLNKWNYLSEYLCYVQNIPQSQCQNRTFSKFHKLFTALRLSWSQAGRQLFLENIQLLPFRRKLQCLEVQLATCIINPYWKSTKTIWAVVCLLEFIAGNKNVKTKLKTLKVEYNLSTRVTYHRSPLFTMTMGSHGRSLAENIAVLDL